jgi:hypothetical protein
MLKTITAFLFVSFLPNLRVQAQHNQWIEPIYIQKTSIYAPSDWDNSNNDKLNPFAVDNQKSTYVAGDYQSGILWFGTKFSAIERPTNYPVLYIAKIDSSGEPQWLKEISNYTKYNGTQLLCISRIRKIEYDSINNQLLFNFYSCTIDTLDSFPYGMKKAYIGALNCESGELESLKEVPGNFLFYKTSNQLVSFTYIVTDTILDGVFYPLGGYLEYFNNTGVFQSRVRIIKPPTDSLTSNLFYAAVRPRNIWPTSDGGTIITGARNHSSDAACIVGSTFIDTSNSPTFFIIKLNQQGQTVWEKLYYVSDTDTHTDWDGGPPSVTVKADGSVVLAAWFVSDVIMDEEAFNNYELPNGRVNAYVSKINPAGETLWRKVFEVQDYVMGIDQFENGDVVFGGSTYRQIQIDGINYISEDTVMQYARAFLLKFDSLGQVIASKTIEGDGFVHQLKIINSDEQLVFGRYKSNTKLDTIFRVGYDAFNTSIGVRSNYGFYIARVSMTDLPSPTRLSSEELLIYANPNTGACSIRVPSDLYNAPILYLDIYNEAGKIISSNTINLQKEDIKLDIAAHANGIYPVRLSNGNKSYFGKIILMK